MTSVREQRTHTIEVSGTELEVRTAIEALRRRDQLVGHPVGRREGPDRIVVDVTVLGRRSRPPTPLRWRRWAALYTSLVSAVGATAHVLAASGALDALLRMLGGVAGTGALAFLAYGVVTVQHRRHCPGCGHH